MCGDRGDIPDPALVGLESDEKCCHQKKLPEYCGNKPKGFVFTLYLFPVDLSLQSDPGSHWDLTCSDAVSVQAFFKLNLDQLGF